jgi:hypothetical protein
MRKCWKPSSKLCYDSLTFYATRAFVFQLAFICCSIKYLKVKEQIQYRAKKWLGQQLTSGRNSTQFQQLKSTDWDLILVLDACRVDTLRQIAGWPVESEVSPASCTPQWLKNIATDGIFDGSHIISGNPQYEKVDADLGCETIEPFWKRHWNATLQTILPEPILERVDEILEEHSRDVVAHLQQPHWPYVAKLNEEWLLAYDELGPWTIGNEEVTSVQVAMQRGLIDAEAAKRAYEASVRSVWETVVEYLARWVDHGYTIIVTADHGETFGRFRDFGFYEHPCSCHLAPLVNVPWIELTPAETTSSMDSVEDRLRALGYAE